MIQLRDIPENIDDKQRDIIEEHNRVMSSVKQLVKSMLDNGKDVEDIAELCWLCGFQYAEDYFIKEDMLKPRKNKVMNKEELIKFLKENMRVYLNGGSCCDTPTISVSVYIDNEEICTSDPIDL